ncbi:MAG: hypothetical protein QOJ51_5101 [Acidobacteriaceae bacterium]|jgi:hypothetical protein|nr:hypothetical protein [Acidobacteriaceae bacterium]
MMFCGFPGRGYGNGAESISCAVNQVRTSLIQLPQRDGGAWHRRA